MSLTLAIDAHGGDHGPAVLVPACLAVLGRHEDLRFELHGNSAEIEACLAGVAAPLRQRLDILPAQSLASMGVSPTRVLRQGQGSSLWQALESLAEGRTQAVVSAGDTAAIMLLARKLLGMLPGIHRPALLAALPSQAGHTWVLDLGANLQVEAEHLLQFGIMGSEFAQAIDGTEAPRVGLVNVGREAGKGDTTLKQASEMLARSGVNYIGYIEGNDLFGSEVDVAVCDGMTGNVVLKASEGVARMLFSSLRRHLAAGLPGRLGDWLARPALGRWLAQFDPAKHNGAALMGLQGVVVKSHGSAGQLATEQAIETALQEARRQVPDAIRHRVNQFQDQVTA